MSGAYLGIEIGGTKLQVGAGRGDGSPLWALERAAVEAKHGAQGILATIERLAKPLIAKYSVSAAGIGFGGPVNAHEGKVVKSHHIAGWADFALADWCQRTLGVPAVVANDADTAGLAEARFGAGRGYNPVFYITVGTGIGGGLVIDGKIYSGHGAGAAEIGHLRPGLQSTSPEQNLESHAAGWGIAAAAQARLSDPMSLKLDELKGGTPPRGPEDLRQRLIDIEEAEEQDARDLLVRCDGQPELLTAKLVGEAAAQGNGIAQEILRHAWQALGWGIAQMITLTSPQAVVIGGGVSLLGRELFFDPLAREVERYVFPPYTGSYRILPAALGEEMVVYGALALAADRAGDALNPS